MRWRMHTLPFLLWVHGQTQRPPPMVGIRLQSLALWMGMEGYTLLVFAKSIYWTRLLKLPVRISQAHFSQHFRKSMTCLWTLRIMRNCANMLILVPPFHNKCVVDLPHMVWLIKLVAPQLYVASVTTRLWWRVLEIAAQCFAAMALQLTFRMITNQLHHLSMPASSKPVVGLMMETV